MKKILVACGAGLATSTMVSQKIDSILESRNIPHKITQCTLAEIETNSSGMDLVVTTMKVNKNLSVPYMFGGPFLTGINEERATSELLEFLKK